MSDKDLKSRQPGAFVIDNEGHEKQEAPARKPGAFDRDFTLSPEGDDPFDVVEVALPRRRKRLPLMSIFFAALGTLLSAAIAIWLDDLVLSLFQRSDWLGYAALVFVTVLVASLLGILTRELLALRRLSSVQHLKQQAEDAAATRDPAHARAIVGKLVSLAETMPETARGRAELARTEGEIIDPKGLIELAESELLAPADRLARQAILAASKRVSIVTAVSPRALVDLGYVVFEAVKLVRTVAEIYGTRPGKLGMLKLFGDVVAHLAVTGSIAIGDGLVQQVLGHGVASKLSQRLGEGVINGLMTARIGIAAMDLLRPLPFRAVKRPGVGDFISELGGRSGG